MAAERQVLSIKDLNKYIRMKLDSDVLLSDVWVRGEISNFTHHGSGHMYFTLKDESSRIKSIMFASHNQRLPFVPKEGTKVIARGNVTVYERDGQYQFYATHMQPDGIGSLYMAYEQLKRKLEQEGLFAADRKRPLPRFPRVVGVVTSPTGAAVRDIIITLQRRFPQVAVVLYPVLVQGKGAAPSIVKAIQNLNAMGEADVLIVGRGGGSLEELWAFNEEAVARAIAGSGIPVISAVGHETDFTIADFAADLRAATPTAAAELAVPHAAELGSQLRTAEQRLRQGLLRRSQRGGERLASLQRSLALVGPRRQLAQHAQRLDMLRAALSRAAETRHRRSQERQAVVRARLQRFHPQASVNAARQRTESITRTLAGAMQARLRDKRARYVSELRSLDALSPLKVMSRGYSLVYDEKEEHLIKSLKEVELGDVVNIKLNDGQLSCQVWGMKEDGKDDDEGSGTGF
ncbi:MULTISPECIES: exodeoxyribonuclease VII large subunit [unclassified Paenibacillus]|uniref:exodeoxyribonuclease VII large subunit n=1 Tax=unclassified Paenibacillus TaxID=185978 RepID=UPI002406C99F|nr:MULTISPECIES: exodeoxyribonuclease VII large subunit [unclassified Paenibacillus]MDF9840479.1 exodeoxyribonuclease VII large subunit [Paenibacillus sp. PastF-2]MDF9847061.1 exodeoxyribonuclease VII large subunit [Paenibacillus sp. PastM-2]MDF9853633.1 exodeoxyribonuclease VII large subunit [Paenibacillus sp. PastF-1]MDH6478881.1 exodeoxyribonuclease VII large subunit [Paenibacillus sp. PastH-2]MDH6506613.1 exodeoxyribonuclease VII large subunit [Paenibacillus sp. PastM-3]